MSATEPKVDVLMGSANDWNIMQAACDQLTALGIANEARVISAHRTPQRHHDFVTEQAPAEGVKVFICGAGMAAPPPALEPPRLAGGGRADRPCPCAFCTIPASPVWFGN